MDLQRPIGDIEWLAFDLENTGVVPGYDRIMELAAARFRVSRDGTVTPGPTFQTLLDPLCSIPPHISALTGITDKDVAGAPTFADAWADFHAWLADAPPAIMLAHSVHIDMAFVRAETRLACIDYEPMPAVCTLQVARRTLPRQPSYKLGALVATLGCAPERPGVHRALDDALHTRNLFAECVGQVSARDLAALGVSRSVKATDAGPQPPGEIPERLAPIEDAITQSRLINIRYRAGSKGRALRPITPMAFCRMDGNPYLRAWCHLDDQAKWFRCDRISYVADA